MNKQVSDKGFDMLIDNVEVVSCKIENIKVLNSILIDMSEGCCDLTSNDVSDKKYVNAVRFVSNSSRIFALGLMIRDNLDVISDLLDTLEKIGYDLRYKSESCSSSE